MGSTFEAITKKDVEDFRIPVICMDKQEKVVEEIDRYQKIINGAQAVTSNYRPIISINTSWKMITVGELFEVVSDTVNPMNKTGTVVYIGLENIESNTGEILGQVECDINSIKSTKRIFRYTDILFGKLRPALNKVAFPNKNGICSTDIIVLRAKDENILPEFYSALMRDLNFKKQVLNGVSGGQLPRVDINYFLNLPIYRVPLTEQKEILDKIHYEKSLIEQSKKIVEVFENKIKEKVKKYGKNSLKNNCKNFLTTHVHFDILRICKMHVRFERR